MARSIGARARRASEASAGGVARTELIYMPYARGAGRRQIPAVIRRAGTAAAPHPILLPSVNAKVTVATVRSLAAAALFCTAAAARAQSPYPLNPSPTLDVR